MSTHNVLIIPTADYSSAQLVYVGCGDVFPPALSSGKISKKQLDLMVKVAKEGAEYCGSGYELITDPDSLEAIRNHMYVSDYDGFHIFIEGDEYWIESIEPDNYEEVVTIQCGHERTLYHGKISYSLEKNVDFLYHVGWVDRLIICTEDMDDKQIELLTKYPHSMFSYQRIVAVVATREELSSYTGADAEYVLYKKNKNMLVTKTDYYPYFYVHCNIGLWSENYHRWLFI